MSDASLYSFVWIRSSYVQDLGGIHVLQMRRSFRGYAVCDKLAEVVGIYSIIERVMCTNQQVPWSSGLSERNPHFPAHFGVRSKKGRGFDSGRHRFQQGESEKPPTQGARGENRLRVCSIASNPRAPGSSGLRGESLLFSVLG